MQFLTNQKCIIGRAAFTFPSRSRNRHLLTYIGPIRHVFEYYGISQDYYGISQAYLFCAYFFVSYSRCKSWAYFGPIFGISCAYLQIYPGHLFGISCEYLVSTLGIIQSYLTYLGEYVRNSFVISVSHLWHTMCLTCAYLGHILGIPRAHLQHMFYMAVLYLFHDMIGSEVMAIWAYCGVFKN